MPSFRTVKPAGSISSWPATIGSASAGAAARLSTARSRAISSGNSKGFLT